jgi:Ca2+-binding RTX toxin-like protein
MLHRMFTYVTSRSVRRIRPVAMVTSGALLAGLMVSIGAGPSVAQAIDPTVLCGMCLTEPAITAVSITGSSKITVNGGGIYANSNAAPAVSLTGSSKIVTNAQVRAVGTIVKTGSSTISGTPAAGLTAPLFADPYPGRTPVVSVGPNNATTDYSPSNSGLIPARADATYRDVTLNGSGTFTFPDSHRYRDITVGGSVTATLKPGRYRNITFGGSSKITLTPGTYWLAGNLNVTSSSKVTGTDSSLVLACGTAANDARACNNEIGGRLVITGSSQLTLNGNTPSTPAIRFVPGNTADIAIDGSSKLLLANSGVDAPNAPILLTGSSSVSTAGVFNVRRVSLAGSSTITVAVIPGPPTTTTTTVAASTSTTTTSTAPSSTTTTTFPTGTTTTTPPVTSTTTSTSTTKTTTSTTLPTLSVENKALVESETSNCGAPGAIVGTPGADSLVGTEGPDVICGFGGNDQIQGLGGDDAIFGGDGNDSVSGGDGSDKIFGWVGNDSLNGDSGADTIFGGFNDDTISGGTDRDFVYGEEGIDRVDGDQSDDVISGGDSSDVLSGGPGSDYLSGGEGNDAADGSEGVDRCVESETISNCENLPDPVIPAQTITVQQLGVTLSVVSSGGIASSDIEISPLVPVDALVGLQASQAVELSNSSGLAFSSANLTMTVEQAGAMGDFAIHTLDSDTGLWVPVGENQIVDEVNRTLTVSLQHFSPYAVVKKQLLAPVPPKSLRCIQEQFGSQVEIDLLVDSSSDMSVFDPSGFRAETIRTITEEMPPGSTLRIVEFDDSPTQIFAGTMSDTGFGLATDAIDNLNAFGATATAKNLEASLGLLGRSAARYRAVILISNGELGDENVLISAQNLAVSKELAVHVVDLSDPAPSPALQALVTATGGVVASVAQAKLNEHTASDAAATIMNEIFESTADYDGDGIFDCEERNGSIVLDPTVPLASAVVTKTTNSAVGVGFDQDADGLPDGLELLRAPDNILVQGGTGRAARDAYLRLPRIIRSSPQSKNSDGDKLDDYTENYFGQSRIRANKLLDEYAVYSTKEVVSQFKRKRCETYTNQGDTTFVCQTFGNNTEASVREVIVSDLRQLNLWDDKFNALSTANLFGIEFRAALQIDAVENGTSAEFDRFLTLTRAQKVGAIPAKRAADLVSSVLLSKNLEIYQKTVFLLSKVAAVGYAALLASLYVGPWAAGLGRGVWAASLAETGSILGATQYVFSRITGLRPERLVEAINFGRTICEITCDDAIQAGLDGAIADLPLQAFDAAADGLRKAVNSGVASEAVSLSEILGKKFAVVADSELDLNLTFEGVTNAGRMIAGTAPLDRFGNPLRMEKLNDAFLVYGLDGIPLGAINRKATTKIPAGFAPPQFLTTAYRAASNLPAGASKWRLDAKTVGFIYEDYFCTGKGQQRFNHPTFDCFDRLTKVAISVKTFNFHRKTNKVLSKARYTLKRYVREACRYTGVGGDFQPADITAKMVQVGLPPGAIPVGMQGVFNEVTAFALAECGATVSFGSFD